MKTLKFSVELTYDDTVMHGEEPDSIQWFRSILVDQTPGNLLLHSQEIGDEIGTMIITGPVEEVSNGSLQTS